MGRRARARRLVRADRVVSVGLLACALLAAAALGAFASPPSAGAANALTVHISSSGIQPQVANVAPGDTVTWVNDTSSTVSVVASDVSFDSGPLAPAEQFQFAFTEARTVAYSVPQIFGASGAGTGSVIVAVAAPAPAPATGPLETPAPASQFAYTGSATAFNGVIGGVALVLGAALIISAQRFGLTAAITGLPFAFVPDDLLPSRRARRLRRARSRRISRPVPWKRTDF